MGMRAGLVAALGMLVLVVGGLVAASPARAAALPSTYYVPLPEEQLRTMLLNMAPGAGNTMHTVVSIVASANGTVIYYDEWEDGYERDPGVKAQASTKVWGDNDPANGIPPGYSTDLLYSGSVITLENDVPIPRVPSNVLYDGGDKIGATYMLAVTRAGWAPNPGTVLAGAVEVHRTLDWGLEYRSPVGTNVAAGDQNAMFDYTGLLVMAGEDGTVVQIDADNNGAFETNTTLAQGQSYLVNGGVRVGGRVLASKPVSVDVITGDRAANYESRFFSLYPVSLWSGTYYSPVGSSTRGVNTETTYVFVYNPGAARIRVTMRDSGGTTARWVNAGTYTRYTMALNTGAQFYSANGEPFFAVTCVGARSDSNQAHDWGFTLIPESSLTTMSIVGWGPGRDASSGAGLTENASPVWVTPVADTTVYVDFDADPTTGPLTDPYGSKYDIAYAMTAWSSQKIYDGGDGDQTGLRLYTVDGTLIATAWGQDPTTASTGAPALDLGTTVLPLPEFMVDKTSALSVDVDGDGFIDPGDTVTYTILVTSVGPSPLRNISVLDPLPANTTYVPNSTTYALYTAAPSAVADDTLGTPYPLDGAGKAVAFVTPFQYFTYTFEVVIDDPLPAGVTQIQNEVTVSMNVAAFARTNDLTVGGTLSVTRFAQSSWATVNAYPGDSRLYIETADADQNMDPLVAETLQVTVVSASGDSEVITLTETGPSTGIFRGTLQSSTPSGAGNNNGLLWAREGDSLTVTYVDPDFPADTSSAVANVSPTLALVTGLTAWTAADGTVVVEWETQSETGTLGFDLLRADGSARSTRRVNGDLVPGLIDSPQGGTYRVVDATAVAGGVYTYMLREFEADGVSREYGPFLVKVKSGTKGAQAPAGGMERVERAPTAREEARAEAARTAEAAADSTRGRRVGSQVKIVSAGPGLVRVTAEQVAGPLGTSATRVAKLLKTGRLALTFRDAPVSYLPAADGSSFVFYDPGAGGLYSDANVFWMKEGAGRTMRVPARASMGRGVGGGVEPGTFIDVAHAEEQRRAQTIHFSDPETDYWLWDYLVAGSSALGAKTFPIDTPGAVGSGGTLTLRLYGVSTLAGSSHQVTVTLNGAALGEARWSGFGPSDLTVPFDAGLLRDGRNEVLLSAAAGATGSYPFLDYMDLEYERAFVASDDRLHLRSGGYSVVAVDGFSGSGIQVFDLSDPAAPAVVAAEVTEVAPGSYRAIFRSGADDTAYLVEHLAAARGPSAVVADVPSRLKTRAPGADYVVIAPTALVASARTLADYRAGLGWKTEVVDLEDIYDEFNGGMASPHAIRAFLSYAYDNWARKPRFVVLAGAGSVDYLDRLGYGGNLVPPLLVSTPEGLVASDPRFGDVQGDDGVPEIAVGRLPAADSQELTTMIAKLRAYESGSGEWKSRALFVADDADRAGDFPACIESLKGLVPDPFQPLTIVVDPADATTPTTANRDLLREWNQGAGFVTYLGHAGLTSLTGNDLFDAEDAARLANGERLPVVSLMTCVAGNFAAPGFDALGEVLVLNPGGGAVAVWAPSGSSRNAEGLVLDEGLVRAFFAEEDTVLGTAIIESMKAYAASGRARYMLDIYNLLGDPALRVR
ncbi:MAG: C25 family cysteine peptidase [Thermoleophilia bacterium]